MTTIAVDVVDRYKDTPVGTWPRGPAYGLFNLPIEFDGVPVGSRSHVVTEGDAGFLDAIAAQYYGPGRETLWWVIAVANNVVDVEAEVVAGVTLRIPPLSVVQAFAARRGRGG
jgi:hypothetical protein